MKIVRIICVLIIIVNIPVYIYCAPRNMKIVKLKPAHFKEFNFKMLLEKRYSCRNFQSKMLALDDIAAILWSTYGQKEDALTGIKKTVPSAGATYPLELYLVVGKNSVDKLKEGVYHYLSQEHSLELIADGDRRQGLADVCLRQNFIKQAPVSLIIAGKFRRTTERYGVRGQRYVYMEAGHACQNTYLAVTNLELGTTEVGAFADDSVKQLLNLDQDLDPISILPIGYPAN
jgi:SagB-type dehydrogenase family enzyme